IQDLQAHNPYWRWRHDACQRLGLLPHQKARAAVQEVAMGGLLVDQDEHIQICKSTTLGTLKIYCYYHIEI
ncbi:hypothetical protein CROQUDRAFT_43226, partial [Cronartium quercuum f. sp. fusiforme G11]